MTVRRLLAYWLAIVVACVAAVPVPAWAASRTAEYVIVVGAAGLRWDDLDPVTTPHLWRMAERGSIAALTVRSSRPLTCPPDGWLTVGAGNFAERPPLSMTGVCPPMAVQVDDPPGDGGFLADQQGVTAHNSKRPWGTKPGALAESVRCSTAIGPGAAVALARSLGRVDRYAPSPPEDLSRLLAQCVLSAVDTGTVAGSGAQRADSVRRVDALVGRVLAARPDNSLILMLGVADTARPGRLHVVIADGPGFDGGWLVSSGTHRAGYLQLVDVAPTALEALGRPRPVALFVGQPAHRADEQRPASLQRAIAELVDADREAKASRIVGDWFLAAVAVVQLLVLTGMVPLLRWLRRTRMRHPAPPPPSWLARGLEGALLASALMLPAALVANLVPWWRTAAPAWVFSSVWLVIVAALTAAVWFSALGRRPLGPLVLVAAIATVMVGVDVLTGARLQLNGVAGYSVLDGLRYSGLGAVSFGVFAAGLVLGAACLSQRLVRRSWRPGTVLIVGSLGAVLVGAPGLGADPGSAIALMVGVCVASALADGGWLTLGRLSAAVLAGGAFMVAIVLVYLVLPSEKHSWVVRLLATNDRQVLLQRFGQGNVESFLTSPLTLVALAAGLYGYLVLLRPWGGLRRAYGLYPAVRGGVYGAAAAGLLGGLASGSGLVAAGAVAATTVPVLLLAGLRVLRHAGEHSDDPPPGKPVGINRGDERRPASPPAPGC